MLNGASINNGYKELLGKAVRNPESKECMLHHFEKCPGTAVESAIANCYKDSDPEVIEDKQWVHTDNDTLETKPLAVEEFIQEVVEKIWNLSCLHYIAKHQSAS